MKAPLNIHPPKNWQDFETLCLKLWGEIWKVPHEIEFNSDNSQGQNGVDIYAPIDGGLSYSGIQCKNKKLNLIDGSPNRITIKDIQAEIEKAKSFIPEINKLIIATSLPKDQKIEQYVRVQSVNNVENGLFSIQICFWEFFERKLLEFPAAYNWYVKNEDFHRVNGVKVTFADGTFEAICNPKFQKTIKRFVSKEEKNESISIDTDYLKNYLSKTNVSNQSLQELFKKNKFQLSNEFTVPWEQNCWFKVQISNIGEKVIEDYKLELEFEGEFQKVGAASGHFLHNPNFSNTVKEYSNSEKSLYIKPNEKSLVQNDYFTSGSFFLKPLLSDGNYDVRLNWKLLSRDFTEEGTLIIKILPKFHKVIIDNEIDDNEEEREEISFKLIDRKGMRQIGGVEYLDKESDYHLE